MTSSGMEYPFVSLGRVLQLCPLQTPHAAPACAVNVHKESRAERQSPDAVPAVWQQPKPCCGTSPALAKAQHLMGCHEENSLQPSQTQHPTKGLRNPPLSRQDIIYIEA